MSDFGEISAIFNSINEEAQKYVPEPQFNLITGGYGLLIASMTPEYGSKNPFIKQSLDTALYLTKLGFQSEYVTSALLSYPHLKNQIKTDKLLIQFGESITSILVRLLSLTTNFEGFLPWVKKIASNEKPSIKYSGSNKDFWDERNAEQFTFAFLAIAQNLETATLKVVERFFLLKNIKSFPITDDTHKRLAQDTLNIFTPVAETLGMWTIKSQLEDAAFKLLEPALFKEIAFDLQERLQERRARIDRAKELIDSYLRQEKISAKLSGRPKHIYGLHKKAIQTKKTISEINDALAIRIIVHDIADCYLVLSALESHFGLADSVYEKGKKYRDWIKTPKPNQYQSIHTTILIEGKMVEVQIRTQVMHDLAEYGAAAHWLYSKAGNTIDQQEKYKMYIEKISAIRRKYEQNPLHMK